MYLLRWRFDYANGSYKYGMWNQPGNHPANLASHQSKDGLIRAAIEGKHYVTRKIEILAECQASEFINFQWQAAGSFSPAAVKSGPFTPPTRIIGMVLITKYKSYNVSLDGSVKHVKVSIFINIIGPYTFTHQHNYDQP